MALLKYCMLIAIMWTNMSIAQTSVPPTLNNSLPPKGTLLTEKLTSTILKENKTGLDPVRQVKIFLPPGYETSGKSYPVVYFCHSMFWDTDRMFEDGNIVALMEKAFATGVVNEFIFVAADYRTPSTGSFYENSPISGRWLDFTVRELVPFIDNKFRTIRDRSSRAITGEFMGGRGAMKLAMTAPDVFSVVYSLHPVAFGNGDLPWMNIQIDWNKIYKAKSFADLDGDGRAMIFVTVCQAFLPNPARPPFYCDFFMEPVNGVPTLNVEKTIKAKNGFHLDESLAESAANLRSMRAIAFDWGRFDPNQAHVTSNRDFSRRMEDLGISHEAEEYRGGPHDRTWTGDGRFYNRLLPFLARNLVFSQTYSSK
jgi:S-formylglutathione hydrolase FrmB